MWPAKACMTPGIPPVLLHFLDREAEEDRTGYVAQLRDDGMGFSDVREVPGPGPCSE